MKSVVAGMLGVAMAGAALAGCSSAGKSDTEFAARNEDGSISILHAHGVAATDAPSKLGNVCWYESRVIDTEFDLPMLQTLTYHQARAFLFAKASAAPISRYAIDCRQGVDMLKGLLPGVDVSAVCSIGSNGNTALTVADAPEAFGLTTSDPCSQMCNLQAPTAYQPVWSNMAGPNCSGSQASQVALTDGGPTFGIFPWSDIIGGVAKMGSSAMMAGAQKKCYRAYEKMKKEEGKANRTVSGDYKDSYRTYNGTVNGLCGKCTDRTFDLMGNMGTLFSGLAGATLMGNMAFLDEPARALQSSSSESAASSPRHPEVSVSQFSEVKRGFASMGASGPAGAKPCPTVPAAILEVNSSLKAAVKAASSNPDLFPAN